MAFKLPGRRSSVGIRPVEVGRRILRTLDDSLDVDVKGRRIGPNAYRVTFNPDDRAQLADSQTAIISELVDAVTVYAREEGYHLLDTVTVTFDNDSGLPAGQFTVSARTTGAGQPAATPAPASAPASAPAPVAEPAPVEPVAKPVVVPVVSPVEEDDHDELPPPIVPASEPVVVPPTPASTPATATGALIAPDGSRRPLSQTTCTIGRSTDNTVALADAQASRKHAEIRYDNGRHIIVDLGSTNGTSVNGTKLAGPHTLTHGDQITIGESHLRYESI